MDERVTVSMPMISPGYVKIAAVYVRAGNAVDPEQPLFEMGTDKASFPFPCPASGTVEAILVVVGDIVEYDAPLLVLRRSAGP